MFFTPYACNYHTCQVLPLHCHRLQENCPFYRWSIIAHSGGVVQGGANGTHQFHGPAGSQGVDSPNTARCDLTGNVSGVWYYA